MGQIQFIQTTPQELEAQINNKIESTLLEFLKHFKPVQPKEYLTRHDVAKMFDVNIGTVNNWSKEGKLKPLGIGSRVYFLRSDIENTLKPLNG